MTTYAACLQIEFTGGALAGLRSFQRCTYATQQAAQEHCDALLGKTVDKPCGGGSPFKVLRAEVETHPN